MTILNYVLVGVLAMCAAGTVLMIGEPRKPLAPLVALGDVVLYALIIWALLWAVA